MESKTEIRRFAVLFALALFIGMAAPAQAGLEIDPETCRDNCKSSHQSCKEIARGDKADCLSSCEDGACRRACKITHKGNLADCAESRARCEVTCRPDIDSFCANSCIDTGAFCQDAALTCRPNCAANLRADLNFCRNFFDFGDRRRLKSEILLNLDSRGECIADAYRVSAECRSECETRRSCNREQRSCVKDCVGVVFD